jgi:mono/diheme cytochrome c family protein
MKTGSFKAPRPPAQRSAILLLAGVAAVGGVLAWILEADRPLFGTPTPAFADADNPGLVAQGGALYRQHCALCHGANLEGQPNWHALGANGRFPAPPQDQRGHSWMHSDAELLHRMKASVYDEVPPGYVSDMPAFKGVLTDDAMIAILAFIKSHWPLGMRAYQAYLNPNNQGLPKAAVGADWSLPIDCGSEPDRAAATRVRPALTTR